MLTKLHFGVGRPKNASAPVKFFDPEEWETLITGSVGKSAPPAKSLSHEFHPLRNLQEVASKIRSLHPEVYRGKSHLFRSVTPHLIDAFVTNRETKPNIITSNLTASKTPFTPPLEVATKSVDIFFDLEAFQYPTVIIDTPGVDHPTPLRRYITWENINEADIYLVMVKTSQGLSDAEVAFRIV